jgi:hypothetical protein
LPFLPVRQINAEKGFTARMAQRVCLRVFVFKYFCSFKRADNAPALLPRAIQLKFF